METKPTDIEEGENTTSATSGLGEETLSSFSANTQNQNSTIIIDNPSYEVKFSGIDVDKDSIISSSSESLSSSVSVAGKTKPKIPDGGWGWMVVLASLILSMIADGVSFSFGLLYVEFLKEYGESKSKTAWIGSLFMAVPLLSGPIMSAFVDRYGCRYMTIAGGIISTTGFILSSNMHSIELQYLTFGVIAGLGLGLCYVTAVVSIAFWFDKRRTLAVGLGACGTGIGTFVYAPMTQYFIDEYGWRGCTLLLAGTFFNFCVCGCLMRDPEWWTLEQNRNSMGGSKSLRNSSSNASVSQGGRQSEIDQDFPGIDEIRTLLKDGRTPEYILTTLVSNIQQKNNTEQNTKSSVHCRSVVDLPTFVHESEKVPLEVLEALSQNKQLYNIILENYPNLLTCRSTSERGLDKIVEEKIARVPLRMSVKIKRAEIRENPPKKGQGPPPYEEKDKACVPLLESPKKVQPAWLQRQFSVSKSHQHYLKHIKLHRNSVMYRGAMLNIHKYRMRASSCPNIYKNSMTTLAKENEEVWYADCLDTFKGMCDFSMLLEFHFLLTSIATILLFTWFIVPYFYLTEHLSRYGYTEADSSKLLSIIGITNTIGMIFLGWAGDQPWMHVTKTYGVCLILCGISTASISYFTEIYWMLVTSCASFGLFFASNFSFTPVILVELVPLDRFTTAYGLILLCQGIGNLVGPPLAGWTFDITHSWETSFNQAGLWIIVAGILMLIIPYTKNRKLWGTGPLEKEQDRFSTA